MEEYLDNDIRCSYQLIFGKVGNHIWTTYFANISMERTMGSMAEYIFGCTH